MSEKRKLAPEVQLCWETMTCRGMRSTYEGPDHACRSFNKLYGPYPAFDWIDEQSNVPFDEGKRSLPAISAGARFNIPEGLSGCRKAPIMTIGINPNLRAFFPGPKGARWAYPYFDNIAQYAEYFRYRTIHQESFSLEFLMQHIIAGSEISAQQDGILLNAKIDNRTSQVTLTLKYDGQAQTQEIVLERDHEVLRPNAKRTSQAASRFSQGDIIAAQIDLPAGTPGEIHQEPETYYQRFETILANFVTKTGLENSLLEMGEDVCQGDMVACASPGWGDDYLFDEERKGIVEECVIKRRYLALQLMQSRPACVVFSGKSALNMFIKTFPDAITPALDLSVDTYDLLRKCAAEEVWLEVETPSGPFKARVVLSGHFSWKSNFFAGSRFSPTQWQEFEENYPDAVQKLVATPKIVQRLWDGAMLVFIRNEGAPTREELGNAPWQVLMDQYLDPPDLMADVLTQEYDQGRLSYNSTTRHLERTDGPCEFCDNSVFSLPGGCGYDKTGRSGSSIEDLMPSLELMIRGPFGK